MVNTYFRSIWDSGYLNLILMTIVRVVRKRFCCGTEGFDPEEATRGSETLDEDTLVKCLG
jgi:hypothetical protein